jgi:hypothetical protein
MDTVMPCLAPSEFLTAALTITIGAAAETIIEFDYLKNVGRAAFFPASTTDFCDFSHGFGNTPLYVAFLVANHPALSAKDMLLISASGDLKIPDIMTNDPARRTEFYEIKPNSVDGRFAGRTKIANIGAMAVSSKLPYVPGIQYTPNKRIKFFSGAPLGHKLDIFFHFERTAPGLILYEFCVEGDLAGLTLEVLRGTIAIAVMAAFVQLVILTGGGSLVFA